MLPHTKIVDKIGLGHADTTINEGEGLCFLVGNNVDEQFRGRIQLALIGERFIADFVQGLCIVVNEC